MFNIAVWLVYKLATFRSLGMDCRKLKKTMLVLAVKGMGCTHLNFKAQLPYQIYLIGESPMLDPHYRLRHNEKNTLGTYPESKVSIPLS